MQFQLNNFEAIIFMFSSRLLQANGLHTCVIALLFNANLKKIKLKLIFAIRFLLR